MLSRRLTLPPHPPAKLNPSPSHSYKLFCALKGVNSHQISNFQTLFAKYPGWGVHPRHPISFVPAIACAAQLPHPLRPQQVAHTSRRHGGGLFACRFSRSSFRFHRPASSLELSITCSLFGLSLLFFSASRSLFSIACSLFSQSTRVGVPPRPLTPTRHGGYWAGRAGAPNHEHRETNVGE
jgi:hypothetical protein